MGDGVNGLNLISKCCMNCELTTPQSLRSQPKISVRCAWRIGKHYHWPILYEQAYLHDRCFRLGITSCTCVVCTCVTLCRCDHTSGRALTSLISPAAVCSTLRTCWPAGSPTITCGARIGRPPCETWPAADPRSQSSRKRCRNIRISRPSSKPSQPPAA